MDAGEVLGRKYLGTGEVRIWAMLIVGVAYWANIVRAHVGGSEFDVASILNSILDNGAFDVFAWGVLLTRCFAVRDPRPASPRVVLLTVFLGLVVMIPARPAPAVALILLGSLLFAGPQTPGALRPLRLVLFALAFETFWMSSALAPLHVLVGNADARIAAFLLRIFGQTAGAHGNVVENLGTQFSIVIWPYCASSFPLADVALAFIVMVFYRGCRLRAAQLPWLVLSFVTSIVLTELRLALLAGDEMSYQWWHAGPGVSVYALAALGLSVIPPILATPRAVAGPAMRPAA